MKFSTECHSLPYAGETAIQGSDSMYGHTSRWHISVLIPAHNEEVLIGRCLFSVQRARIKLPPEITSDVIVVDDASSDQTKALAERILGDSGKVIRAASGVVGNARSVAAKTALARYNGPSHLHWLANTDADCSVPETWLRDQLALAETNVQAIAGVVSVDSFLEHEAQVEENFRRTYLIHADGTHPHVHGANLGVRADAYVRAGGWNPLPTAEDHDLWKRLSQTGAWCVSPGSITVCTSGRRIGRAPLGFAQTLAADNTKAFESVA